MASVYGCPDCSGPLRQARDTYAYSCLGCGLLVSARRLHARSYGPRIFGDEPIPMPAQEYLPFLIEAEGPIIYVRGEKRG